jgi:hypothetical protein
MITKTNFASILVETGARYVTIREVKQLPHRTVTRRYDEPKLISDGGHERRPEHDQAEGPRGCAR